MKIISKEKNLKPNGVVGVVYGPEGIGKTSLAAALDNPLFFDAEHGAYGQKVDVLDEEVTLSNIMKVMQELIKDNQGYKTFVLDTMDAIEIKLIAEFCEKNKISGIEDIGYGKGYTYHAENFAKLLDKCRELADSGVNVVMVCHAEPRKFETPEERGTYDRWTLKMMKQTAGLVKEAADWIVFINYKTNIILADKKAGETKSHATGGKRWCYTNHTTAYDGKSRVYVELPDDCSLDDMVKTLPAALRNAVNTTPVAKKTVETTQKKDEASPKEAPQEAPKADPHAEKLAKLREAMAAYSITEDEMVAYGTEKHNSRYGEAAFADWNDNFIDWLLKGMDQIAKKIKG